MALMYEVPLALEAQEFADIVCERFGFPIRVPDLSEWNALVHNLTCPKSATVIAIVGKYVGLHDAYLSVAESLVHAGAANHTKVKIKWVESQDVTPETAPHIFGDVDGILVAGGFGNRESSVQI